jgi:predicted PurR-regulated permease PerM
MMHSLPSGPPLQEKRATGKLGKSVILGLFLTGLLALTYLVVRNFVIPVAWAIILTYISWPLHLRLKSLTKGHDTISALLMTIMLLAALVIPFISIIASLEAEAVEFYRGLIENLSQKPALPDFIARIPYFGRDLQRLLSQFVEQPDLLRSRMAPLLQSFSGEFVKMLGDVGYNAIKLVLTLLTVFFLYRDGHQIIREVRHVLRLFIGERLNDYMTTAGATVKAVVYGLVLTAIAQGVLAGLGYWFVGIQSPVLLGACTAFFSLVPFGTPLVWVSASIWLLLHGEKLAAIQLILWGSLVVSWVDNLIRPLVISSTTRIPFLIVLFGVFGGLASFGLIGLFLGPVILAVTLGVWREWLETHAGR